MTKSKEKIREKVIAKAENGMKRIRQLEKPGKSIAAKLCQKQGP